MNNTESAVAEDVPKHKGTLKLAVLDIISIPLYWGPAMVYVIILSISFLVTMASSSSDKWILLWGGAVKGLIILLVVWGVGFAPLITLWSFEKISDKRAHPVLRTFLSIFWILLILFGMALGGYIYSMAPQ